MTETTAGSGLGRLGAAGAAVAGAAAVTNGFAYLVPMLGARHLPAEELSVLATVLALVAIAGVTGVGLQMAVAVHCARHPGASTTRVSIVTTAVTAAGLSAAAPLLNTTLRLPVEVVALLVGLTVPVVLAGGWLGELQGEERFVRLAWGMGALALGRYAGMVAALVVGADVVGTLVAGLVTAYAVLPVLAVVARRGRGRQRATGGPERVGLRIGRVMSAGTAALAMLVVSYADLILARLLLPAAESGAYSVGTVLTKGALWAPQVVTVLALPRMARRDSTTRTRALAVVGGCGVVLVVGSALAGGLAFRLAGGENYAALGRYAPFFAATGALYALVFVQINAQIAVGARWPSTPLWAATGGLALVAVFLAPHTFSGIMWSSLSAAAVTTLVMTVLGRATARKGRAAADDADRLVPAQELGRSAQNLAG